MHQSINIRRTGTITQVRIFDFKVLLKQLFLISYTGIIYSSRIHLVLQSKLV